MARRQRIPGAPRREACHPAAWALPDAAALQALSRGDAGPDQQKRALTFIVESLAGTYDLSFRGGKPDETAFAEGKRFVGMQIVKLVKVNLAAIRGKPSEQQP